MDMNQSKWRNFIVGAMIHEGVRQEGDKYIVNVSDLTFDLLKDAFPTKYQNFVDSEVRPMYRDGVTLPKGDGSQSNIIDNVALEDYKDYIISKVGDVEITLDPNAQMWSRMATIEDPKFKKREAGIGKEIAKDYGTGKYEGD